MEDMAATLNDSCIDHIPPHGILIETSIIHSEYPLRWMPYYPINDKSQDCFKVMAFCNPDHVIWTVYKGPNKSLSELKVI